MTRPIKKNIALPIRRARIAQLYGSKNREIWLISGYVGAQPRSVSPYELAGGLV